MKYLLPLLFLVGCAADAPAPDTKRIAITYDDAPRGDGEMFSGVERTAQLIASLDAAESGPVAIFVTTQGMDTEDGRGRVRAYADAGHIIANHSDTHRSGNSLSVEDYLADIDTAEDKLEGLEGIEANRRPWFRFPFLHEGRDLDKRDALRAGLDARGLMSGYVTVDTYDWHMEDRVQAALKSGQSVDMDALERVYVAMVVDAAEHYDQLSRDTLGRRAAHVLLVHENDIGAEFADEMIAGLREAGWEIIHPDEAFADPIAERLPRTVFAGRGRIAAIALDEGADSPDVFGHWSAHRSAIDARLESNGVFGD